ncbi:MULTISPECIES: aminodeoxychorismate/anthranilate synthase component II [unclassified Agarivorans]|uniref:aminodeoxychorismate/anthranilate synthase component II n=1 Tax=unclassified Agarivorans TaxID=2636026 RepID=UPI003D7E942F
MTHSVFLLDNFDSFTYNLVDQFRSQGLDVHIYRNHLSASEIKQHIDACPDLPVLVLSPGPGNPQQAGCMLELIDLCKGQVPIIGICLGHQALVESYGGEVGKAEEIVHGKSSLIEHDNQLMFEGLTNPLPVARYHSLVATKMPTGLTVNAHYQQMPMAIINQQDKVIGFQFHPESILTSEGASLLARSLDWATQAKEQA